MDDGIKLQFEYNCIDIYLIIYRAIIIKNIFQLGNKMFHEYLFFEKNIY